MLVANFFRNDEVDIIIKTLLHVKAREFFYGSVLISYK